MKPKTKAALVLLLILGLLAAVGVLTYKNRVQVLDEELVKEVKVEKYPVKTVLVEPESLTEKLVSTGVLEAEQDVVVSSEVGGKVKKMLKSLGDRCQKGELLAHLDTESFGLALAQAEAALAQAEVVAVNAEREWKRMQKLKESQVATGQQLDNAEGAVNVGRASVNQAEAAVRLAKRNLKETSIKCPFDGFIAEKLVERGETIGPQAPIARLVDTSRLKLVLSVTSDKLSRIEVGQRVVLSDPALPGVRYDGAVSRLGIAADPNTRTFPVEVEIKEGESRLRTGQVVQAELTLGVHENVVAVPASTVRLEDGKGKVVVVKKEKAEIVDVKAGRNIGGRLIIEDGLAHKDEVVVVGGTDLRTGDRVEVTSRLKNENAAAADSAATTEP